MQEKQRSVNVNQVAEMLNCSKRHVYNLYHREDISGFWNGNCRGLRIYFDSVVSFRDSNGQMA